MDKDQFLSIIVQNQGTLHKICRLYRDTPEDREDLFQEMIYQLWKSLPSFKGDAQVSTWLYRVALNTALTAFRKRGLSIIYTPDVPEPSPPVNDNRAILEEQLFAALNQLGDAEKALIAMYLDGLSYQEMAAITGTDENYIGVKLNRIKTKIKNILKL
ncbi:MAG TPA: sigma-70 family RNA polymerase sigma factor [Chitinophaga sp.]|uniref:RNA polymerase sigma factor n=1 Tax=Chitinophaga sp. TaxID=1869181 RepID=UPI002C18E562|nr:sigma-70 family RNA polymerase sigma factor [Chitinophaga sp.]HVI48088.1 sigma-70 family RNA polymerase sigma factor [Chitinophaga sp.]